MLVYLKSVKHDVCLVSVDFAGLTTRTHDIVQLIETNPAIKKIAIETFTVANELFLFDSESLTTDAELLEKFNCRKKSVQRSK
ncbi:hypothetical protein BDF21DRAFT_407690 [Thamnidium elegans]|nr:hypothetical protein BDF21DRAFT_407690 [Thamnidium elegans]